MKVTPRMYAESLLAFARDAKREDVEMLIARVVSYYSRRGKSRVLDAIAAALVTVLKERDGVYAIDVQSAHPLTKAEQEQIEETIARIRGGRPEVTLTVDDALIAGTVLTIGDTMIDASLSSRINHLKNALIPKQ